MKDIWNAIKSIFVNDAHNIISQRGKEILAEQQKEYTFIPNPKTTRTQSDMVDIVIGVNGKRRRVETDYNKIFNNQREIKREMKQTAVEWLRDLYENQPAYDEFILDEQWQKAIEMEKEQKGYTEEQAKQIWKAGQEYWKTSGSSITFEELTETFNTKEIK
jgi:hypothetical protein